MSANQTTTDEPATVTVNDVENPDHIIPISSDAELEILYRTLALIASEPETLRKEGDTPYRHLQRRVVIEALKTRVEDALINE